MDKKKILIIDDEPNFLEVLKARLEMEDYEVIATLSGAEGLLKAKEEQPDLILLDVVMPEMDGYTVLKHLRADRKTKAIPVIAVTARPGVKELFAIEGVKGYIVKPFEDEDLISSIQKAME